MQTLATHFSAIIALLRSTIAVVSARDRARTPLLMALWNRVGRMATRFERLYTRWQTGTLRKPQTSRAGQKRPEKPRTKSPFPTTHAWLMVTTRETSGTRGQLEYFLALPDLAAFLAAAPQAARILRPLCQMLGNASPLLGTRDIAEPRPPRVQPPRVRPPRVRAPSPAARLKAPKPTRPAKPPPYAPWPARPPPPRDYDVGRPWPHPGTKVPS